MIETFKKTKEHLLVWAMGTLFLVLCTLLSIQYSEAKAMKQELASLETRYILLETYNRDQQVRQQTLNRIEDKIGSLDTTINKLLLQLMKK